MNKSGDDLVFVALGGVGEIGMNLGLYGLRREGHTDWLMVDCGIAFAGETLPGIDAIIPDTRFIEAERNNLAGIVITHAHEDHYGALLHIWPKLRVPVFATSFVAALLEAKAAHEPQAEPVPVSLVEPGERIDVGDFSVEFIAVAHSIPQANALAISTQLGTIVHTGDWKIDPEPLVTLPTDEARFRALGDAGVTALVCDSTNAPRFGASISEATIAANLQRLVKEATGRVVVTSFASNVARIRTVAEAARAAGRQVVMTGGSMMRVNDIARDLGILTDFPPFLGDEEARSLAREDTVVLATGTQGEWRAAMARMARGEHAHIDLVSGDRVIFSSRAIPGNEKAVSFVINRLVDKGVEVITDTMEDVHVTGHARRDELRAMYTWTRPELLIPVHGEAYHLEHQRQFALAHGVGRVTSVRNGDMVRLAPDPGAIVDSVPAGRVYRDGMWLVDADQSGVSRRRKLAYAGHIAVAVTLSRKGGLLSGPDVAIEGLPTQDDSYTHLEEIIRIMILGVIDGLPRGKRKDRETVREAVRRAIRRQIYNDWGKKPICTVFVTVV